MILEPRSSTDENPLDINNKQQFLDYLEERHNARMLNYNPEVNKEHDDSEIKTMREVEEIYRSPSVEKLIDRFDLEMANIKDLPF